MSNKRYSEDELRNLNENIAGMSKPLPEPAPKPAADKMGVVAEAGVILSCIDLNGYDSCNPVVVTRNIIKPIIKALCESLGKRGGDDD